jgi:hypothetical protein
MKTYNKTFEIYFDEVKNELICNDWKLQDIYSMKGNFQDDHYQEIIENVKNGSLITEEVFNSLDSMKQYHFNKHYNYYNDKIVN